MAYTIGNVLLYGGLGFFALVFLISVIKVIKDGNWVGAVFILALEFLIAGVFLRGVG